MFIHEGSVYETIVNDHYDGFKEVKIEKQKPVLRWKGGKIPYQVWSEIVAFMLWSQETHSSEAMITLFYNTDTKQWAAWAFPQETAGMTVSMQNDSEKFKEQRKQFGDPWVELGSVHHHCTSGAFASSTDKQDELDRDGIHITLGNLNKDTLDIHFRASFNKIVSDTDLATWLEKPIWINQIPDEFPGLKIKAFEESMLKASLFNEIPFFTLWRENVKKKIHTYTSHTAYTNTTYNSIPPDWKVGFKSDAPSRWCYQKKQWMVPPAYIRTPGTTLKDVNDMSLYQMEMQSQYEQDEEEAVKKILQFHHITAKQLIKAYEIKETSEWSKKYGKARKEHLADCMNEIEVALEPSPEEYIIDVLENIEIGE